MSIPVNFKATVLKADGANTQGDISVVEAAERAAVGRREKVRSKRLHYF